MNEKKQKRNVKIIGLFLLVIIIGVIVIYKINNSSINIVSTDSTATIIDIQKSTINNASEIEVTVFNKENNLTGVFNLSGDEATAYWKKNINDIVNVKISTYSNSKTGKLVKQIDKITEQ